MVQGSNQKKVAVLLASYNGEKYVAQQIKSILNQDVDNPIHLFVRDDGSTDNTVSIVNDIIKQDNRVTLIEGSNVGGVACFFALLRMAHDLPEEYAYFSLSDQDDVWDFDKIRVAINAIEKENSKEPILYCSTTRPVKQNLEPIQLKPFTFRPFDFYNTIIQIKMPGHTHVMNRALLDIVYDADTSQIYGHDAFIVNAAKIKGRLVFDNTPHTSYRQHEGNQLGTGSNISFRWIQSRLKRIKKGGGVQYARQIEYIYNRFGDNLTAEQNREVEEFLDSRKNFLKRLTYITRTKLYRQSNFDTLCFKLMYLFGGYNIK